MNFLTLDNYQTPIEQLCQLANNNAQLTEEEHQIVIQFENSTKLKTFLDLAFKIGLLGSAVILGRKYSIKSGALVALTAFLSFFHLYYKAKNFFAIERKYYKVADTINDRYSKMIILFEQALEQKIDSLILKWNDGKEMNVLLGRRSIQEVVLQQFEDMVKQHAKEFQVTLLTEKKPILIKYSKLKDMAEKITKIEFLLKGFHDETLKKICSRFIKVFPTELLYEPFEEDRETLNEINLARTYNYAGSGSKVISRKNFLEKVKVDHMPAIQMVTWETQIIF